MKAQIQLVDGRLVRGPRLKFDDVYGLSAHYNVKHVVDLEAGYCTLWGMDPDDEQKNVEHFGMRYHPHPLGAFKAPTEEQCRAIMRVLYGTTDRVYVHCHAGVDRTGFIVALYGALRYGRCAHQCWEDALEDGMHLRYHWFWKKAFLARCKELKEEFGWAD